MRRRGHAVCDIERLQVKPLHLSLNEAAWPRRVRHSPLVAVHIVHHVSMRRRGHAVCDRWVSSILLSKNFSGPFDGVPAILWITFQQPRKEP